MSNFDNLLENLPSLYRPDSDDQSVLAQFLRSVSASLGSLNDEVQFVLNSHWYTQADDATMSPYLTKQREHLGLGTLSRRSSEDRRLIETFPYIEDLARLGGLLSLPPWREPVDSRESVEDYRLRLARIVALYSNGLGTLQALQSITEASLVRQTLLSEAQWDRAFAIESNAALTSQFRAFKTRGQPENIVGPLMRWTFNNTGLQSTLPHIYIKAVEPIPGQIDATENPLLERYSPGIDNGIPIGIAYRGSLAPQQVIRIASRSQSLLASSSLQVANVTQPDALAQSNWNDLAGAPTGEVHHLHLSYDRMLWAVIENTSQWQLWRYNGDVWLRVVESISLPQVHCVWDDGHVLYLGSEGGIHSIPLYPDIPDNYQHELLTTLQGVSVFDAKMLNDGNLWVACSEGLVIFDRDYNELQSFLSGAQLRCIYQDKNGVIYLGGQLGLFQYQPGTDDWYFYHGESESDQFPDWQVLETLPTESNVFMPPINDISVAEDGSVWLATEVGLVRWVAHSEGGLTFKTRLESFADILPDNVHKLKKDERGILWVCSDRGLFKFNGRDILHYREADSRWLNLGRADRRYRTGELSSPRGSWRFNRSLISPDWQFFNSDINNWTVFDPNTGLSPLPELSPQTVVSDLLWIDIATVHEVSWDAGQERFVELSELNSSDLVMRVKPTEDKIYGGGIPGVPLLPKGASIWRYLALEEGQTLNSNKQPFWTREGRIFPPPEQAAAFPGRMANYLLPPEEQNIDQQVFAYNPTARVWLEWRTRHAFNALVRLDTVVKEEIIHPVVLDRVWDGIQRVRPAGVQVALAVDDTVVRGGETS